MCIILKVDLGCCRGCREWICRNLKRVEGVKEVKVGEDDASIVVCGEGLDEAEIVGQVKKRKGRSKVEVVSRLHHNKPPNSNGSARQASPQGNLLKPKYRPPLPPCVSPDDDTSRSMKAETMVTERMHKEFQGTKIRTRVTTSQDACTCIRVEETRLLIDKQQQCARDISCMKIAFDSSSTTSLLCHHDVADLKAHFVPSCQH
eukprot:c2985_g1_i1 orf=127-735(+)